LDWNKPFSIYGLEVGAYKKWKLQGSILRIYGKQDDMENDLDGFQTNLGRRTSNVM